MKRMIFYSVLFSLLAATAQPSARAAEEPAAAPSSGLARKEAVLATITASVEAIDYGTREVTLKGPLGNTVTFNVDSRVKRLLEIKVGDLVQADYYVSLAAELRKPTPEEEQHPLTVLEGAGKAPQDSAPAGGAVRRIKAVTTVEGLDRIMQTVTVKGPRGRILTARVEDPSRLMAMRLGDTIVITYTEALAISLTKVEKKSAG